MSRRFRISLLAWITVLAVSIVCKHAPAQDAAEPIPVQDMSIPSAPAHDITPVSDAEWTIEIIPRQPAAVSVSAIEDTAEGECTDCAQRVHAAAYARIYNSIPFNRAEYNANPTYRHDSTMEILTGNARHQTVVHHGLPGARPAAAVVRPAAYNNQPLNPASYGYLRPALRLNYYRYFPSLNPYLNVWNLSGAF